MVGGLSPPILARLMAIDLDQLAVRRPRPLSRADAFREAAE